MTAPVEVTPDPSGTPRPPAVDDPRPDPGERIARGSVHRTGVAAVAMAAGVLAVSAAYAAGRGGAVGWPWEGLFWAGEVLLFVPVVWRLLARRGAGRFEAGWLVVGLAVATYLTKFFYSPLRFEFPDELQHQRSLETLLATHHLYGVNHLLPVSPAYPGLQEATSALMATTGLSMYAAGMIVAGLAHVLLIAGLYVVFLLVGGTPRIAGVACAVYATNPHFAVFDAIFGYQTLGLALLALTLIAALAVALHPERDGRARRWILAVGLIAATVVTHHVTSYVLIATLVVLALATVVLRRTSGPALSGREAGTTRTGVLAVAGVVLVAVWLLLVASPTVLYLAPSAEDLVAGLRQTFTHSSVSAAPPASPLPDRLASYAAALVVVVVLPIGWLRIWRTRRHRVWPFLLLGSAYYAVLALRVVSADGAELAGRALTYLYIPVGYVVAVALVAILRPSRAPTRRRRPAVLGTALGPVRRVVPGLAMIVMLLGGLAGGWPPYWERLPGRYIPDGFESGFNDQSIATAVWSGQELGPDNRVAADFTNYLLLGSYGGQDVVSEVNALFTDPRYTAADAALIRDADVEYLVVDVRLSRLPAAATAGYFPTGNTGPARPIPRADLLKWDQVPGVDRIYANGSIVIYRLPEQDS